jgi:hypothetical protein
MISEVGRPKMQIQKFHSFMKMTKMTPTKMTKKMMIPPVLL